MKIILILGIVLRHKLAIFFLAYGPEQVKKIVASDPEYLIFIEFLLSNYKYFSGKTLFLNLPVFIGDDEDGFKIF